MTDQTSLASNPEQFARELPRLDGIVDPPRIGDRLYYPISYYYVAEVHVVGIDYFLQRPEGGFKANMATCLYITPEHPNGYWSAWPTIEVGPHGWNQCREATEEELRSCVVTKWEIDIDLPVGHAVELDEKWGDCYAQLANALKGMRPTKGRKRKAASVLHRMFRSRKRFIASTHHKPVGSMDWPHYPRYGERKVYWRKR